MPPGGSAYWAGSFTYAPGVTVARDLTRDGRAAFGDVYEDISLPRLIPFVTATPPPLRAGRAGAREQLQTQAQARAPAPPATPRPLALAPGASLALGGQSFSIVAPVSAAAPPPRAGRASRLMAAAPPPRAAAAAQSRREAQLQTSGRSVTVILDGVGLTELGKRGGYFYKVYLNLPHATGGPESGYLLGTLGPFEIAAARHRMAGMADMPARLEFPATEKLRRLAALDAASLVVSFVRVDGSAAAGDTITVDSFKVEATG
jgi:tyrosinase